MISGPNLWNLWCGCIWKEVFHIYDVIKLKVLRWRDCCYCSVAQSCLTLCNPIDCTCQASLSSTISQNLLKFMSIESVMPSNCLVLCHPLLLLLRRSSSITQVMPKCHPTGPDKRGQKPRNASRQQLIGTPASSPHPRWGEWSCQHPHFSPVTLISDFWPLEPWKNTSLLF